MTALAPRYRQASPATLDTSFSCDSLSSQVQASQPSHTRHLLHLWQPWHPGTRRKAWSCYTAPSDEIALETNRQLIKKLIHKLLQVGSRQSLLDSRGKTRLLSPPHQTPPPAPPTNRYANQIGKILSWPSIMYASRNSNKLVRESIRESGPRRFHLINMTTFLRVLKQHQNMKTIFFGVLTLYCMFILWAILTLFSARYPCGISPPFFLPSFSLPMNIPRLNNSEWKKWLRLSRGKLSSFYV